MAEPLSAAEATAKVKHHLQQFVKKIEEKIFYVKAHKLSSQQATKAAAAVRAALAEELEDLEHP